MQGIREMRTGYRGFLKAFVLAFIFFSAAFLFGGCVSADKSDISASIAQQVLCDYDAESDTTTVSVLLKIENNTIYNCSKEELSFNLLLGGEKIKSETHTWELFVKAGKTLTSTITFTTNGKVDDINCYKWSGELSNLWETYKTWWLSALIVPIILGVIYLIIRLIADFELSEVFENAGTWAGTAGILVISLFASVIGGNFNWFPAIICFIGIVEFFVVLLIMSGIAALVDCFDINLFEKVGTMIERKKDERVYKNFLETVNKCGTDKKALAKFDKNYLLRYCDEMDIAVSGRRKMDCIDAIAAFAGGDKTVLKKKNNKKVSTSSPQKVANKKCGITFNDIAGLTEAKNAFIEKVVLPFEHPELYKKYGKKSGGGILLYGLPGTGKTMFAEAASNEVNALFLPVKCSDIKSKWYGESEKNIKDLFVKAKKARKAIIFFDEFEAIGAKRTDSENGNNDLVPEILAEMQGVGSGDNDATIVVIAATNKPWAIDSAFLRPGRFDEKIYIPLPDDEARKKLFSLKLKGVPTADLDYEKLANLTEGFNGADITEFCEKLKMRGITQSIKEGETHIISMEDVEIVAESIQSSVAREDIESLEHFQFG